METPIMLRLSLIAAAMVLLAYPSYADAQSGIRITVGYGYPVYQTPYGSYKAGYPYHPPYGKWGYGNPYQPNVYRPYYNQPVYKAPKLSSGTGSAMSGPRNNGNYWYWLQQQANQGRIPQSEVNRRMYGNR